MREILFRGKRRDNGEWFYGDLLHLTYCVSIRSKKCANSIVPETVGEYTGLKDKNGVRVFEGDIIDYAAEKFVVKYIDAFATFDLRSPCNMAKLKPPLQSCMSEKFYAVIGNVHDNPELLKGE